MIILRSGSWDAALIFCSSLILSGGFASVFDRFQTISVFGAQLNNFGDGLPAIYLIDHMLREYSKPSSLAEKHIYTYFAKHFKNDCGMGEGKYLLIKDDEQCFLWSGVEAVCKDTRRVGVCAGDVQNISMSPHQEGQRDSFYGVRVHIINCRWRRGARIQISTGAALPWCRKNGPRHGLTAQGVNEAEDPTQEKTRRLVSCWLCCNLRLCWYPRGPARCLGLFGHQLCLDEGALLVSVVTIQIIT